MTGKDDGKALKYNLKMMSLTIHLRLLQGIFAFFPFRYTDSALFHFPVPLNFNIRLHSLEEKEARLPPFAILICSLTLISLQQQLDGIPSVCKLLAFLLLLLLLTSTADFYLSHLYLPLIFISHGFCLSQGGRCITPQLL